MATLHTLKRAKELQSTCRQSEEPGGAQVRIPVTSKAIIGSRYGSQLMYEK
jgi:hypothetical protein